MSFQFCFNSINYFDIAYQKYVNSDSIRLASAIVSEFFAFRFSIVFILAEITRSVSHEVNALSHTELNDLPPAM